MHDPRIPSLLGRLSAERPDLASREVIAVHEGADKIALELRGGLLARFAKTDAAVRTLQAERSLLATLAGKVTLRIPRIEIARPTFDVYEMIPGVALTADRFHAMPGAKQHELAQEIARFLHEVHSAFSLAQAHSIGVEPCRWPLPSDTIRVALRGHGLSSEDETLIENVLGQREALPEAARELRLLHNDLGGHNFAFDPQSEKLRGVFDFGDACIQNLHQDFHYLRSYSKEFEALVVKSYEASSGLRLRSEEIAIRYAMNTISHVAYAAMTNAPDFEEKRTWLSEIRARA